MHKSYVLKYASASCTIAQVNWSSSVTEEDVAKEAPHNQTDSGKKPAKRIFHLFHHKQKKPQIPAFNSPSTSDTTTVDSLNSGHQDELEREELVDLLINPSKVLQTKEDDAATAVLHAALANGDTSISNTAVDAGNVSDEVEEIKNTDGTEVGFVVHCMDFARQTLAGVY